MSDRPLTFLSVVGTRPEVIKMAPVIRELERRPSVRSLLCATGQHRELLGQALGAFGMEADVDLDVMQPDQGLSQLTARLIDGLDGVVTDLEPDWILAQGDTTTVLAAALVAFYRDVRFAHVEAGLRTADLRHPFPEELNRRLADQLAALQFAPTQSAVDALVAEGNERSKIRLTGNTVVDSLLQIAAVEYDWRGGPLGDLPDGELVLVTAHRRESFGEPMRRLCLAVRELADSFADEGVQFVFPVHLNPHVRGPVAEVLEGRANVWLTEPLDYATLVHTMMRSTLVLTDSGGIQEEAPSFGVPVLVMRDVTERPEGVEAGFVELVGTSREAIVAAASRLLRDPLARAAMSGGENPYGDGRAAVRIVDALLETSCG